MKKIIFCYFILGIALLQSSSCGPEMPYVNKHVMSITPNFGQQSRTYEPPCCVTIDCEPSLSGCQSVVDEWGYACADGGVCVERNHVDTVYKYYYENDMSRFYSKYDIYDYFPILENQRPGSKDSLINGNYKLHITSDSSIVIVKNPVDSVGFGNIVFVFDRNPRFSN